MTKTRTGNIDYDCLIEDGQITVSIDYNYVPGYHMTQEEPGAAPEVDVTAATYKGSPVPQWLLELLGNSESVYDEICYKETYDE